MVFGQVAERTNLWEKLHCTRGEVTRGDMLEAICLVALNACVMQVRWSDCLKLSSQILLDRLSTYSAILTGCDGAGRKMLLNNVWISSQIKWERFKKSFDEIGIQSRLAEEINETQQRVLTREVADWFYHFPHVAEPQWYDNLRQEQGRSWDYFWLEFVETRRTGAIKRKWPG